MSHWRKFHLVHTTNKPRCCEVYVHIYFISTPNSNRAFGLCIVWQLYSFLCMDIGSWLLCI